MPEHADIRVNDNSDLAPQPIHRQPAHQCLSLLSLAIDQHIPAISPQEKVEQCLTLGAKQSGPERQFGGGILRHQALQKAANIFAVFGWGQTNDSTVEKAGIWHR